MNFPNDQFEVRLAEKDDLVGIKEIFESGQFDGGIAVQYLRNPDPIASFMKEGDKVFALVLEDKVNIKLVGIGVCIVRNVYLDSQVKRMGYLAGLKILPEYQKKVFFIPLIYQHLYEITKEDVDFYFTTILSENLPVQKMLEKPRKQMPLYEYLGDYRVYFCKAGIKNAKSSYKKEAHYEIRQCQKIELEQFFKDQIQEMAFSLTDLDGYDLRNAIYYGLFLEKQLVACGYILNQQSYKQYVVKKYSGKYKLISKLPTRLLGYPSFPKEGERANCACANIWAKNNDESYVHHLWQFMKKEAKAFDFIMIGLYDKHPLRTYFEKTKHISYDSRCYIVDFEKNQLFYKTLQNLTLNIDVSFL